MTSGEPVELAMGLVAVVAAAASIYLGLLLVVITAARLGRRRGFFARVALALAIPGLRGIVATSIGTCLTVGMALPVGAADPSPPPSASAMTLRRLPDAPSTTTTTTTPPPAAPTSGPVPTSGSPGRTTWTIQPGEHFWHVASVVVAERGSTPTEFEIARYWRSLIEANRSVLADPTNPDLVFPGQVLTLPVP